MDSLDIVFSKEGLYNDPKKSEEGLGLVILGTVVGLFLVGKIFDCIATAAIKSDRKKIEKFYNDNKDNINIAFSKVYDEYKDVMKRIKPEFIKFCKINWSNKHDLIKYCKFKETISPDDMIKKLIGCTSKEDLSKGIIEYDNIETLAIDGERYCETEEKLDPSGDTDDDIDKIYKITDEFKSLLTKFKKYFSNKYKYINFNIEDNPDDYWIIFNVKMRVDFSSLVSKIEKETN